MSSIPSIVLSSSFKINKCASEYSLIEFIETEDNSKLKFKFVGDDSYISKILTIKNISDVATAELQIELIAL